MVRIYQIWRLRKGGDIDWESYKITDPRNKMEEYKDAPDSAYIALDGVFVLPDLSRRFEVGRLLTIKDRLCKVEDLSFLNLTKLTFIFPFLPGHYYYAIPISGV